MKFYITVAAAAAHYPVWFFRQTFCVFVSFETSGEKVSFGLKLENVFCDYFHVQRCRSKIPGNAKVFMNSKQRRGDVIAFAKLNSMS